MAGCPPWSPGSGRYAARSFLSRYGRHRAGHDTEVTGAAILTHMRSAPAMTRVTGAAISAPIWVFPQRPPGHPHQSVGVSVTAPELRFRTADAQHRIHKDGRKSYTRLGICFIRKKFRSHTSSGISTFVRLNPIKIACSSIGQSTGGVAPEIGTDAQCRFQSGSARPGKRRRACE
jgi:hypothetical protein